jgi:hypothetical protein
MTPARKRRWFTFSIGRLFELTTICAFGTYVVTTTPGTEKKLIVGVLCLILAAAYFAMQSTVPVLLRQWRPATNTNREEMTEPFKERWPWLTAWSMLLIWVLFSLLFLLLLILLGYKFGLLDVWWHDLTTFVQSKIIFRAF